MKKTKNSTNWFAKTLLAWWDKHGRKSLPWQQDKTPYRVWVSEIMLQQTQVATVIPYFLRFIERFPTIKSLAQAKEDDVLHLWTGLGYYTRARNLYRTAKIITDNFKEIFPNDLDLLQTLPGIGRSTAGAILAIAFAQPATILDGNVKRVLARFHAILEWPGEKNTLQYLWQLAEQQTPRQRVADYTQAIMDLGATVCTRSKPDCSVCPLQTNCLAHQQGIEKKLPKSKTKKTLPVRTATVLVLRKNDGTVFLEKRLTAGVWIGLWSLPEISGFATSSEIKKFCAQRLGYPFKKINYHDCFRHTFSHFHLDILPVEIIVTQTKTKIMDAEQQIWYNLAKPAALGLPAPIKSLLSRLT